MLLFRRPYLMQYCFEFFGREVLQCYARTGVIFTPCVCVCVKGFASRSDGQASSVSVEAWRLIAFAFNLFLLEIYCL